MAEGPEVTWVNPRPAQSRLLELKCQALRSLSLEHCRQFFGVRPKAGRVWTYRTLVERLSPAARAFWDAHLGLIESGLLNAGRIEQAVQWVAPRLVFRVHPPGRLRRLFRQKNAPAQTQFYKDEWNTARWRKAVRRTSLPWTFLRRWRPKGEAAAAWPLLLERAIAERPVRYNYFLSRALWGRHLPGERGLPPVLRRDVFEKVRNHVDRLRWIVSDVIDFLLSAPAESFTKMTLSTAFEKLTPARAAEAFAAAVRAMTPGGRLVLRWRRLPTPPPKDVPLRELAELSDRLTAEERAFLYARVSVYERD